ncbi:MAG: cell wall hydrolase, partial [Lachnospiraceae bacterium]|nr:cell wall hydrolase [Lachnospiraceae bacterium]
IRTANEDAIEEAVLVQNNITKLSTKEYNILARIVEAEATDKDKKSKILVANVVLNRVRSEEFPDTVEGVVFQNVNGAVQFSPVADGRYYSVPIKDSTLESVDRALAGEDYSEGALYFVERDLADSDNVNWFDRSLTRLFEYEGHEFYK